MRIILALAVFAVIGVCVTEAKERVKRRTEKEAELFRVKRADLEQELYRVKRGDVMQPRSIDKRSVKSPIVNEPSLERFKREKRSLNVRHQAGPERLTRETVIRKKREAEARRRVVHKSQLKKRSYPINIEDIQKSKSRAKRDLAQDRIKRANMAAFAKIAKATETKRSLGRKRVTSHLSESINKRSHVVGVDAGKGRHHFKRFVPIVKPAHKTSQDKK